MTHRQKVGLALIIVFLVKASLSLLLETGFDPYLVCLNGLFLVTGLFLFFW